MLATIPLSTKNDFNIIKQKLPKLLQKEIWGEVQRPTLFGDNTVQFDEWKMTTASHISITK